MVADDDDSETPHASNLVAESDLKNALDSIQIGFEQEIPLTSCPAERKLLADCAVSFSRQIRSLVQPVTDENYPGSATTDEGLLPFVISEEVDDDFEESELIDVAAKTRLQELRKQVCERAAAIRELREMTLKRPVNILEKQFQLMKSNEVEFSALDEEQLVAKYRGTMDNLTTCLGRMVTDLQRTEAGLPENLQKIQDTVAQVEKGIQCQPTRIDKAITERVDQEAYQETTEELKLNPPHAIFDTLINRGY